MVTACLKHLMTQKSPSTKVCRVFTIVFILGGERFLLLDSEGRGKVYPKEHNRSIMEVRGVVSVRSIVKVRGVVWVRVKVSFDSREP